MRGVYASPVSAKMVKLKAIGDFTDHHRVGISVRCNCLSLASKGIAAIAIALAGKPYPAIALHLKL